MGDDGGLRIGPGDKEPETGQLEADQPETGQPGNDRPERAQPDDGLSDDRSTAPSEATPRDAITRPLPTVTRTDSDHEQPRVRAVARRAAAALPALGRDDGQDQIPGQVRATVDRRRRAQAAHAAAGKAAGADAPEEETAVAGEPVIAEPGQPEVSAGSAVEDLPVADPDLADDPDRADDWGPVADADPGQPLAATSPHMPEGRVPEGQVPEGTEIDLEPEGGEAIRVASAMGLPDARTDEWGVVGPATRPREDATAELVAASAPAAHPQGTAPPGRGGRHAAGPRLLEEDSWEAQPQSHADAYHGRRRAPAPAARLWLVIALVLVGVAAAVAVPFLANRGSPQAVPSPSTRASSAAAGAVGTEPGELAPPASSQPASPTTAPTTTEPALPPPPPTRPPAAFSPLSLEAEDATLVPPAELVNDKTASGGRWVGCLGTWPGDSRRQPCANGEQGALRFNEVIVPEAGTYRVVFRYLAPDYGDRVAYILVNGEEAATETVNERNDCCGEAEVDITLRQGENTIEFTNPKGRCPAIDRIVITRP